MRVVRGVRQSGQRGEPSPEAGSAGREQAAVRDARDEIKELRRELVALATV